MAGPCGQGLALAVAAALVVGGAGALVVEQVVGADVAVPQVVRTVVAVEKRTAPRTRRRDAITTVQASAPENLSIEAVGIEAPVTAYTDADVAANDGWVDPPEIDAVSWWAGGGTPGSAATNTVYLYGHVSHLDAVFNRLRDTQVGETVTLTTATGTLEYAVVEVLEPIAKEDLPSDARVTAAVPGRLVLIGCYRGPDQGARPTTHNTVVLAQLVAASAAA